jgi:hypothetical protein
LDFGFDPSAVAAGSQQLTGNFVLIGVIAFVGFFGRLLFVAFAPSLAKASPFKNLSGPGFICLAIGLFFGGLYVSGKMVKAQVLVSRHLIDPVIVTILGQDSCDPDDGSYCVVVFENGEERLVNWHDKRVFMYEIVNPPQGAVWNTLRPRGRPEDAVDA